MASRALALLGLWKLRIEPGIHKVPVDFELLVFQRQQLGDGSPLRTRYTGLAWLDALLSMLVGAFMPGVAGWPELPTVRMQQMYFLVQWFAVVCVWAVEGYRVRNVRRVVSYTTVFAILYQIIGGAFIVPVYYIFHAIASKPSDYYLASRGGGSQVRSTFEANSLLPALVLGYLTPTIALYLPWGNQDLLQVLAAIWQPAPFIPNLLVGVASIIFSCSPSGDKTARKSPNPVFIVYIVSGVICAAAHIAFVSTCLTSPNLSLASVLLPNMTTWKRDIAHGLLFMFQWDFWVCFASTLLWCWVSVADTLRVVGSSTSSGSGLVKAGVGIVLLSIVAGPGAAVAATWYWVDDRMCELEEAKDGKDKAN
ncbi:hypothetical protein B0H66DRAFT_571455 [Apodospora peruviana]|uniref:Uncharacterized protein n=1 Tax=Apodospora peruviana TaxID=516989 RepID=A0AAE0LY03_9PEZI|nr:hypothetical protein B0H66DRAFT_571455 [Apodospora peruviana]